MIPGHFAYVSTTFGPQLGNHLWQSTVFAIGAGLLAFALRENQPRYRYWIWLSASVKFLIPFSLLISVGSHMGWFNTSAKSRTGLYFAVQQVSDPFTRRTPEVIQPATSLSAPSHLFHILPLLVSVLWLCGFAVVLSIWYMRWRRISTTVRGSQPLLKGREIETLRKLERVQCIGQKTSMFVSQSLLEPGIFGIVRPTLVWPCGISEYLQDAHLEAILTHELSHVRRRDNLAATIHMLVEAVFWFHPIVWWLGARMVDEREQACDEEVLRSGSGAEIYAESILNVCKFCLQAPLTCMSGVTGSDLKKRVQRIMTNYWGIPLSARKRLLLAAITIAVVAVPVITGMLRAQGLDGESASSQAPTTNWQAEAGGKMAFEVASVKQNKSGLPPNGDKPQSNEPLGPGSLFYPSGGLFRGTNLPASSYIFFAYKMSENQVKTLLSELPKWATSDRFDIEARAKGNPTKDQMRLMMQALLEDRFKLKVHTETRQLPVYVLVLVKPGKTGPQLQAHPKDAPCSMTPPPTAAPGSPAAPPSPTVPGGFPATCGGLVELQPSAPGRLHYGARNSPIGILAVSLTGWGNLDRPILDQTGLSGNFDYHLEWTPQLDGPVPPGATFQPDPTGPTFLEALRDQFGLKLEPQTGPVEVFVVNHVEEPSPN